MAKKQTRKAEGETPTNQTVLSNGTVVQSKVVTGKKTRLTARQQGQLARGEIDENLEPTGKAAKDKNAVRTIKTSETLYQGPITASAIASATGEKVSFKWDQAMPTTHKGLFHSFLAAHPSADYDTFEIDSENVTDPTLRTSLEK
jgi:hypothetical protein